MQRMTVSGALSLRPMRVPRHPEAPTGSRHLLYSPPLLSVWLSLIPAEASDEGLADRQASRAHKRLGQRASQFSARLIELAIAIRSPEQSVMDMAARGCDLDQFARRAMGSCGLARLVLPTNLACESASRAHKSEGERASRGQSEAPAGPGEREGMAEHVSIAVVVCGRVV